MPDEDLNALLQKANDLACIIDLREAQEAGLVSPPGKISQEDLAKAFGLSRSSYRRLEAVSLAKAAAGLGDVSQLRALLESITSNNQ